MAKTLIIKGADFSANKLDTVEFLDIPCIGISINKTSDSLNIGEQLIITETVTPSNTTDAVVWTSSNNDVATVSNGVVTAKTTGSTTITAKCGTKIATCNISVVFEYSVISLYYPQIGSSSLHYSKIEVLDNESGNYAFGTVAMNSTDMGKKTIESDPSKELDYRLVPISIPNGTTAVKVSSANQFKTNFLWFDSTKVETYRNNGAYCISGAKDFSTYDQSNYATEQIVNVVSGADSFAIGLRFTGYKLPVGDNPSVISIEFIK